MKTELELLKEANDILRSIRSIIERKGKLTNWDGINEVVKMALAEQHELLVAKTEKRYVMYQDHKCELLGTTDAGGTLNTGGLAFCIILPDGKVKNVQDTHCTFL